VFIDKKKNKFQIVQDHGPVGLSSHEMGQSIVHAFAQVRQDELGLSGRTDVNDAYIAGSTASTKDSRPSHDTHDICLIRTGSDSVNLGVKLPLKGRSDLLDLVVAVLLEELAIVLASQAIAVPIEHEDRIYFRKKWGQCTLRQERVTWS
jgi:hypothetical protein